MTRQRIVLEKLRSQLELKLQGDMLKSLRKQGWWADKTSDRFKAGKPDIRIGNDRFGQMDVELKYSMSDFSEEDETGLKKLQKIKMEEMNKAGMPAVGLIYSEPLNMFFVTNILRDTLPPPGRCALKLSGSEVIAGPVLFVKAMEYLQNDLGYHRTPRDWRQAR